MDRREGFCAPLDKGFGENVDSRLNLGAGKVNGKGCFSLDLCDLKAYKGSWEVEYGEIASDT